MENVKRLIELDFPLEQVSLDSVHEKNVRHGHISTLHIWPARRPLAACRAALIATLLPDPGNNEERKAIYRRLAGEVVEVIEKKKVNGKTVEKRKRETRGGILHWGRESGPDLDWFRQKIREAYGGRAPRVLDPFAGGGAIPLEAMRLGCEATAIDINPVAWFILKCTLEYPQKLAGQTRPLPAFALKDRDFMEAFLKAKGFKGVGLKRQLAKLGVDGTGAPAEPELGIPSPALRERVARRANGEPGEGDSGTVSDRPLTPTLSPVGGEGVSSHDPLLEADLAWQVRAWGRWVLAQARKRLAHRYPTYAEFQALEPGGRPYEKRPLELLEPDANGNTDVAPLNAAFPKAYLADPRNPRWVAKPTVAYLWARTVRCKGCRATIPLLKTRWLAKKDNKRVLLMMTPNDERTGVVFGVETNVPAVGGNAAQRREHDKRRGAGTMTRSGAQCPCCPTIMTMKDVGLEGRPGKLGTVMTAVVIDGPDGKEYRLPAEEELRAAEVPKPELEALYTQIPFGLPTEPTPRQGPGAARAFSVENYGLDQWAKLFTDRQLLVMAIFLEVLRRLGDSDAAHNMYSDKWAEALTSFLIICVDRLADYSSNICSWHNSGEKLRNTFGRFALPIVWDYTEVNPLSDTSGNFLGAVEWVSRFISRPLEFATSVERPIVHSKSATRAEGLYDVIMTDPPYYDAIPYSDLMDFFYVWLRRSTHGLSSEIDSAFRELLGPKWDHTVDDGELIDDASRFGGDKGRSRQSYEDGMARAFRACHAALTLEGRLVVVFANKQPDAWEALVGALIRAGFVVDGSWPIQTEMGNRTRSLGSAALASSVWLVCKKRPPARPGFDTSVLADMRARIHTQLRAFWGAGIRGPDFVWAATGPALEAYSKYPVVKKADAPDAVMTVSEFLREVRRLVVDFVVGRVLSRGGEDSEEAASLDDVTTYYLLHRNDFGLDDAPIGACILYALSCNLSDGELADRFDILVRSGRDLFEEDEDAEEAGDAEEDEGDTGGKGNKVKLKPWNQRRGRMLGLEAPGGRPVPLIDQAHRLMHLWKAADQAKVDDYLDARGLKRHALFAHLLQALIELAAAGAEERAILESLSNHIAARGGIMAPRQEQFALSAGS